MKQLEMFEVTPLEIGLVERIVTYRSMSAAGEAMGFESAYFANLGKRLCPSHDKGELWNPYFEEWLEGLRYADRYFQGELETPENIYEDI